MNRVILEILFLVLLIALNGLFAMSEMAIVAARKTRLQQRADGGDRGAQVALELAHAPNQFLSTVQVGITLVGILAGAFGGATLADELAAVLNRIPWMARYSEAISVSVVVVAITYLSLIVGELAPKRLALSRAERIASAVAPFMRLVSRIAAPAVRLLSTSTDLVLRALGMRPAVETPISEEEIRLLIEQATQVGVFVPTERDMIERVLALGDRPVNALMTPRTEVVWLNPDDSSAEIGRQIAASGHSRYPVARGNVDEVLGVVYTKDLLAQSLRGQPFAPMAVLRPALFVPESISALGVLERFKESRSHVALVIDEYGGFQGLVTINDILSAVVGDVPLHVEGEEPEVIQREDGSWLLDGKVLVDDLIDLLQVDELSCQDARLYQTIGGLVMASLGRIPSSGDHFEWNRWRFEVMDMDGRRVDKVLVAPARP